MLVEGGRGALGNLSRGLEKPRSDVPDDSHSKMWVKTIRLQPPREGFIRLSLRRGIGPRNLGLLGLDPCGLGFVFFFFGGRLQTVTVRRNHFQWVTSSQKACVKRHVQLMNSIVFHGFGALRPHQSPKRDTPEPTVLTFNAKRLARKQRGRRGGPSASVAL